eukprot:gene33935-43840_t
MGHVESRVNLRGPPRKAKYSWMSDSEIVPRGKGNTEWRSEPTNVEKLADELWLGVKCQSKAELAGREVENTKERERTLLKELGKIALAGRLKKLVSRKTKLITEAPVNGGRNYNGPKEGLGEIELSVKMRTTCARTVRPYEALLYPEIESRFYLRSIGGQFDWGGRLPKGNGGVQRFPQIVQKSILECKGKRKLNCETNKSSRDESRVPIDEEVWHLDVGSSHPGAEVRPKGWAVRPLKRYVSWVQNVARQFGPYPAWALEY